MILSLFTAFFERKKGRKKPKKHLTLMALKEKPSLRHPPYSFSTQKLKKGGDRAYRLYQTAPMLFVQTHARLHFSLSGEPDGLVRKICLNHRFASNAAPLKGSAARLTRRLRTSAPTMDIVALLVRALNNIFRRGE